MYATCVVSDTPAKLIDENRGNLADILNTRKSQSADVTCTASCDLRVRNNNGQRGPSKETSCVQSTTSTQRAKEVVHDPGWIAGGASLSGSIFVCKPL